MKTTKVLVLGTRNARFFIRQVRFVMFDVIATIRIKLFDKNARTRCNTINIVRGRGRGGDLVQNVQCVRIQLSSMVKRVRYVDFANF